MQTIDLADTLCLSATGEETVRLVCTRSELSNEENLAARAARMVRERLGLRQGVLIELDKHIPVAAGLGGGSSDAAAVLLALRQWWNLPLSSTDLLEMAAELGSDVPFFLQGGLALCEGRGERVTGLPARWPTALRWLVLLKPAIAVATVGVFRNLPFSDYSDGSASTAVQMALGEGRDPDPDYLRNSLERGVLERYPPVAEARAAMLRAGAPYARLSGSGPTLFAPFPRLADARAAQESLQAEGYEVYLSRAISPNAGVIEVI